MLFVDLDKTLIKSDYLLESFVNYFSKNIFAPIVTFYILLKHGKVGLKKFLYENSIISVANLPYNQDVLDVIEKWKKKFPDEKVILISATYYKAISKIANHLKCFDEFYGTKNINLKSKVKLEKIHEVAKNKNFFYIGDSSADLPIWENAKKCYVVNPTSSLLKKLKTLNRSIEIIHSKSNNVILEVTKSIRLYQWTKNFLLFVPAILSFKYFPNLINNLVFGFFAFSLISSAFYIINDLFDIENDRLHHSKKHRSFASSSLSIPLGFFIFCILTISSIIISVKLSQSFQVLLIIYAIASLTYTKYIKKLPILDILTLSFLYLLRILAGGELIGISITNWLLTFSVFFFLFLASVKRWVELKMTNKFNLSGRGYLNSDIPFLSNLSYFSGLICVLVSCLYIESQYNNTLFANSRLFWLMPVLLLYWILETLFKVERNSIDDDPVKYALKSKTSYIFLIGLLVLILFNI